MSKHIKIIMDDETIFEEDLEDVKLSLSRKVTPLYMVGDFKPFTLAPSAKCDVSLIGSYRKVPNAEIVLEE